VSSSPLSVERIKMPSVSVVIPTYNRSKLLLKAIESVLRQTYADYELIVIDDGSTDDTRERLLHIWSAFGTFTRIIRERAQRRMPE